MVAMKAIYQYIINIMIAICNYLNALKCSAVWLRRVHRIAQRGQSSTLAQVFSPQYYENKMMCDEITFLLILYVSRINAYRALASPSLISLSSKVRI